MTVNGQPVVVDRFTEPGCRVTLFRDNENIDPEHVALFRGGLGDVRSSSMGNLAHEVLRESEGEFAVGIVRTVRPLLIHRAIVDSVYARERRAESMHTAIEGTLDRFQGITSLTLVGQSEGGVTVVDGMTYAHEDEAIIEKLDEIDKTVVTMEAPGVFGPVEYDGTIAHGLGRLLINCVEDVVRMSNRERMRMLFDATKRGISPFEVLHILGEISYLKDLDMSGDIARHRDRGIRVHHTFRDRDVVDGAEVDSEHSMIFSGKHLGSLHGEGAREVARHLVDLQGRYAHTAKVT